MTRVTEKQSFYLLLILGAGYFLHLASTIPTMMRVVGDPGPGFLPFWVSAIIMLLMGYLLVVETLIKRESGETVRLARREAVTLTVTLTAIVLYLVMLSLAGFFVSTLAFLFVFRLIVNRFLNDAWPTPRTLLASALFALASTSAIYLVFSVLFGLSMP
ncbi:tripartite tricarboxylate transporter TctB family protein [Halomonas sp. MCCC 1A11036]|uniref:Tripartite tricarboxylate transporter TctB family protein n=1 Tax=Billgrantia zhangzhouensis TaxID=2733481 RepID=A0ABS9AI24_9GAMM|nr:tripartite tricarboxylate transporter TctB family protein [Halomonas zhangzhouensis]MCE8021407.1 tripartite tricarboxylate transporter TctB family protein [Halomonas zhangzhouensis]